MAGGQLQGSGQSQLSITSRPTLGADRPPIWSLAELLALPADQRAMLDIALVNLLCAEGLPGADGLEISACLSTLDRWAFGIKRFTADNRRLYYANPQEYEHHHGFFKFMMMCSFLKHPNGIGIAYQPTAIGNYDFRDSRDDFLHGLLSRRLGTCASLPVLAVALGRRLGYPMYLAIAKNHVFCQWVDERGRFNLELSCPRGGDTGTDEDFARGEGRRAMTDEDKASERYLRPLTPAEEFASFLEIRGHCLADNRRFDQAREAYAQALAAAPSWSQYQGHLGSLNRLERLQEIWVGRAINVLPEQMRQRTITDAIVPDTKTFPTLYTLPGYTTGLID